MKCQRFILQPRKKKIVIPVVAGNISWMTGTSTLITASPRGCRASFFRKKKEEGRGKEIVIKESQEVQPQHAAYANAQWWLCRDQRALGAQTAGPRLTEDHGESSDLSNIFRNHWYVSAACACVCVRVSTLQQINSKVRSPFMERILIPVHHM